MTAHRLITIPISHFCEKARWALDRAGVSYVEERHLQAIHAVYARRAGGGVTVPVFVCDDGEVLAESTAIVRWADGHHNLQDRLYPVGDEGIRAARIEAWLDVSLGPQGRLWMYESTLPVMDEMAPWLLDGVPSWERKALRAGRWALNPFIRWRLGVDAGTAVAALADVDTVFDDIAHLLADGRPYLCGERFTAADLTFAALSAAVLAPEQYGSPLPPLDLLPPAMVTDVRRLRDHPAGQFAARMYEQERQPGP